MLLLLSSALAQSLLVPEFTPESVTDFTVSYMMYDQLLRDMRALGMEPVDGDTIRRAHGDIGDDCATDPGCVDALLAAYPDVPMVVVGSVGTTDEGLTVEVHYFVRNDPDAVKTRKQVLAPGAELQHTSEIARQAADLLSIVTMFQPLDVPLEDPSLVDEDPLDEDPRLDPVDEDPGPDSPDLDDHDQDDEDLDDEDLDDEDLDDEDLDEPYLPDDDEDIYEPVVEDPLGPGVGPGQPDRPARPSDRPDTSRPVTRLDDKAQRRKMGVNKRNYQRFLDSKMEPHEWMEENHVRTGTFSLELGGGYALGSVDRRYDVVLVLEEGANGSFVEQERYERDQLISGAGGHGSASLAVGLNANFELGLLASVQFAHKWHNKGWEHHEAGELENEYRLEHDPAAALVAYVEPRLRVYLVQRGPIKPYVLGLGQLRIYDGYEVEDTAQVNYPDRPPLYPFGAGGGGGLMVDVNPGFALFVEASYSRILFGAEALRTDAPSLVHPPDDFEEDLDTVRIYGGLSLKF